MDYSILSSYTLLLQLLVISNKHFFTLTVLSSDEVKSILPFEAKLTHLTVPV